MSRHRQFTATRERQPSGEQIEIASDASWPDLTAWVESDPQSALAHLMRANCYEQTAWAMRGEDFSSTISDGHMQAFHDYLHKADEDVRKSIALNPNNPCRAGPVLQLVAERIGDANSLFA